MYVSTPLPLLEFADTLESYGGLSPSKEFFETVILVSVFVISVLAIGPIA